MAKFRQQFLLVHHNCVEIVQDALLLFLSQEKSSCILQSVNPFFTLLKKQ